MKFLEECEKDFNFLKNLEKNSVHYSSNGRIHQWSQLILKFSWLELYQVLIYFLVMSLFRFSITFLVCFGSLFLSKNVPILSRSLHCLAYYFSLYSFIILFFVLPFTFQRSFPFLENRNWSFSFYPFTILTSIPRNCRNICKISRLVKITKKHCLLQLYLICQTE